MDHGRAQLDPVASCAGLYCKVISTRNNVWYPHADINVQVSVNWQQDMNIAVTHDATSSWVENVTPESFRACVMDASRKNLLNGPSINWFAYQGKVENIKSHVIEVGEWRSGTHCAPIHERTVMEKPIEKHPKICPSIEFRNDELSSSGMMNNQQEQWHYDSHVMSEMFGQQQQDWMKKMMSGYGVKRMNLTDGVSLLDHKKGQPNSENISR